MTIRNMLDGPSERPLVYEDASGEYSPTQRMDIMATLALVHELDAVVRSAPGVTQLASMLVLRSVILHMGWHPYEVAAVEQATASLKSAVDASTR